MEITQLGSCRSSRKTIDEPQVCLGDTYHKVGSFGFSPLIDQTLSAHGYLYEPERCRIKVKIGRYIEMTMPPITTPRKTIMTGSISVMRFEIAASASSS